MLRSLPKLAAYMIIMLALVVASFIPYNFGLSDLRNATEWVPTSPVLLPATFLAYPALPSEETVYFLNRDIPASTLQIAEALALLLLLPVLYRKERTPTDPAPTFEDILRNSRYPRRKTPGYFMKTARRKPKHLHLQAAVPATPTL